MKQILPNVIKLKNRSSPFYFRYSNHVLLSDLDQHRKLGLGLPELLGLGEDVPPGRSDLEAKRQAGVRELGFGGEQELGVRHQEVQLQVG